MNLKDVSPTLKVKELTNIKMWKYHRKGKNQQSLLKQHGFLTSKSGKLNSIFLSNLPGLISAGSKVSGLLVAISTLMFPRGSKPSSWLISSNIVLCTSLSPPAPSSNRAPAETRRHLPGTSELRQHWGASSAAGSPCAPAASPKTHSRVDLCCRNLLRICLTQSSSKFWRS